MIARVNEVMLGLRAESEAIRVDTLTPLSVREARLKAAEDRATEERVYALEDLEAVIREVVTRR